MSEPAVFVTTLRVYLEDTDAQGIVYHANYLKFFERARTDWLASRGPGLAAALAQGLLYVVHELRVKFKKPARLGEALVVQTCVERASSYRLTFQQKVLRPADGEVLVDGAVEVVCVDTQGRLRELDAAALGV